MKINNVIIFLGGLAIGAMAGHLYNKKKYENAVQEEIQELRERYSVKHDEPTEKDDIEESEEPKSKIITTTKSSIDEGDDVERERINYQKYSKIANEYNPEEDEYVKLNTETPYIIKPDEFGTIPLRDTASYYLYEENHILVDEDENVINTETCLQIFGMLADDIYDHFGEFDNDQVFFRNNRLELDIEVCRELGSFE